MAGRPVLRIVFKNKLDGKYVNVCAYWRNENGMLSGKLDSNVDKIRVKMKDGSVVDIDPASHFVNAFEERSASSGAPKSKPKPSNAQPVGDPDDGDDVPFDLAVAA